MSRLTLLETCPHCHTTTQTLPAAEQAFQAAHDSRSVPLGRIADRLLDRTLLRILCGRHTEEFTSGGQDWELELFPDFDADPLEATL